MRQKFLIFLIILAFACKNGSKEDSKKNNVNFEDTVEFLVYRLDKRNVELIKGNNIIEVEFKLVNKKKC